MKKKTRIGIACQGGGSQTAFSAGVLHALMEADIQKDFEIVSLSGTSGGAVCATLLWYSLQKGETPACDRLLAFWHDNMPQSSGELWFNDWVVQWVKAVHSGQLAALHMSPDSQAVKTMMSHLTWGYRDKFTDFRMLLEAHIDFDEIASWGPRANRPVLLLGACNVLTGRLRKFVSSKEKIQVEHVLASCAVPNIFPAVQIGKDAYWDGLFSDNPPVDELIRPVFVGKENVAEEIWIVKINPTAWQKIPIQSDEILDRRNQLEGNVSLFQQLVHVEMLNDLLLAGAFKDEFTGELGLTAPVRIPKSFASDPDRPYHIPWIEMSAEVQDVLKFEGKIDRGSANIEILIEDGRKQGRAFLEARAKATALSR